MNSNAGRGFLKAIIVVGLFFIVTYFYSYNKWLDHDFNKVDITYKENNENENINENTEKDDSKSLDFKDKYEDINYELFESMYGEEFYNVFYENKAFSDEFYVFLGVANIIKNDAAINGDFKTEITSQELKNKITSIVGNVNYTDKSFNTKNGYLSIIYNSDLKKYSVSINNKLAGIDFSKGGIRTIYQNATKDDNYLYIYEKAFYLETIGGTNGAIKCHEGLTKDSKIIADSYDNIDLNQLSTYVFKFKINKDVYTLESITKK